MADFYSEHESELKLLRWRLQSLQLYLYRLYIQWKRIRIRCTLLFLLGLLGFAFYITTDNVPTNHLDFTQSWFDRKEVLASRLAEAPSIYTSQPTYTKHEKLQLGNWENFDEETMNCPIVQNTFLYWVLKTPKAASSTLQDLIIALHDAKPERYVVNSRQIRINHATNRSMLIDRYKEYFLGLNHRTVYSAHGWFLNLATYHNPMGNMKSFRPICIGTLRDPLKRLMSHYDYLHEGPRSASSIERHGQTTKSVPNFNECVVLYREQIALGKQELEADQWKCMHWANIQLKYFCGYDDYDVCAAADERAYAIALSNIQKFFLVVGLVERFDEMLLLLQKELPIFSGIAKLYRKMGSSRVNTKTKLITPSSRGRRLLASPITNQYRSRRLSNNLTPEVSKFLTEKLFHEQKLYEFAADRFSKQMKACELL